jgi:hypothetical protein
MPTVDLVDQVAAAARQRAEEDVRQYEQLVGAARDEDLDPEEVPDHLAGSGRSAAGG